MADWSPVLTGRLVLRRVVEADRGRYRDIHGDERTNLFHPMPLDLIRADLDEYFDRTLRHWADEGFGPWAVAQRAAPNEVIGFTGLSLRTYHSRLALNLFYRYDPMAWGRGIATEGALAAVAHGRALQPSYVVVAMTTTENVASRRTAERVGLVHDPSLDLTFEQHGRRWTDVFLVDPQSAAQPLVAATGEPG